MLSFGAIVSLTGALSAGAAHAVARGRPAIVPRRSSDGSDPLILSDDGSLLRGVSLSFDGGDPFDAAQDTPVPSLESLESLRNDYGLNSVHVYLNGDASDNTWPIGHNEAKADALVERTGLAGLYLIITIGCNGENGSIYSMPRTLAFWGLYGLKYKDETHVIYEAHNEPVAYTPNHWTTQDWDNQVIMYDAIRSVAPDTLVLLGSFMSFNGGSAAIGGADYLASQGIDWSNAAFAFHGYTGLGSIEDTIAPFEELHPSGGTYPALLCTEFFPGDTENGYNAAFESHFVGWSQFEWLGGCDTDLDAFRARVDRAGTIWQPDSDVAAWPAAGLPTVPPANVRVGIFKFSEGGFLRVDPGDYTLQADQSTYEGGPYDSFFLTPAAGSDRVYISISEDLGDELFLVSSGESDPVTLSPPGTSLNEDHEFEWIESLTGDVFLRSYGGGHLLSVAQRGKNGGKIIASGDDAAVESLAIVTGPGPIGPVPPPVPPPTSPPPPGPFHGAAQSIPGTIQFADFNYGGEGVAYRDSDAANVGEVYRPDEGVDIQSSSEDCIPNVGWVAANEWMTYTVDVVSAGEYGATFRMASASDCRMALSSDDDGGGPAVEIVGSNTGGWQAWQDFTAAAPLSLLSGQQVLRVENLQGGCNLLTFTLALTGGTLNPAVSHIPSKMSSEPPSPSPNSASEPPTPSPNTGPDCSVCAGLSREPCQGCSNCKWGGVCRNQ